MTRDFFQSDRTQPNSVDRAQIQMASKIAQEAISDWLLKIVKLESPSRVITEFNRIFIEGALECTPTIADSLRAIVINDCEEDFVNTIKRCCYILLNNWHRDERATTDLIQCLKSAKTNEKLLSLDKIESLESLKCWILNFLESPAYREIEVFASPKIQSPASQGIKSKEQKEPWVNRYRSYLLVSQSLDTNKSHAERDLANKLSKQLRNQFKFDLAMYTARYDSSTYHSKTLSNPTQLGEKTISLIKQVVSQHNLFQSSDRARIWLDRMMSLSYEEFKQSFQDYLIISLSAEPSISILQDKLSQQLEVLYENHDRDDLSQELVSITCKRTIEYFTTEDARNPSFLFLLLASAGHPLTLSVLLIKILMLCRSARKHLELCIAKLIQHYESAEEEECRWLINFLDVFDLVFTIYTENVRYDLVKINDGNHKLQSDENLENYRLFCRSQGAKLANRNLSGANLSSLDLRHAELQRGNLPKANLTKSNLHAANLHGANLQKANLQNAHLSSADLSGANLSGANLSHTDLRGANLSGANLMGADLSHADLDRALLRDAQLDRALLRHVSLCYANLSRANLTQVDLTHAQLDRVNLSYTNLSHAFLRHTNLSNAYLRGAKLTGANLYQTNLSGAKVQGAQFGGNSGLSVENKQVMVSRGAIFGTPPIPKKTVVS
ncbi:pentapeptide repeat-containing protein [Oscillatoriales cyanobacterium LEGE 11467]|uniref:Pentapeptide repeat-containing protein n=1 Tax=Zarconia navalis LEGE 11467 TaxID=1828826 RepID=A0A928VYH3_9CYAN|nr:pentapeptide repeat-containing protein [Zarconia navalis]MBE9040005.1 pentapeptide repeat-containing protein [Zarconia navalis LEGE 11467]